MNKILVVGAHLDDEVLGVGGTIARHANAGDEVFVLNVSDRTYANDVDAEMVELLRSCANKVQQILGIQQFFHAGLLDKHLDREIVLVARAVESVVDFLRPNIIYTHHGGDVNQDHRSVFEATVVAIRSFKARFVEQVYSYEILSSTEQIPGCLQYRAFVPNHFVDISSTLSRKLEAMNVYETEIGEYPFPRSLRGIEVLARFRGMQIHRDFAEAFETVKVVR
jgi:LmbE family N-acetylglucosaminyl deacetylase